VVCSPSQWCRARLQRVIILFTSPPAGHSNIYKEALIVTKGIVANISLFRCSFMESHRKSVFARKVWVIVELVVEGKFRCLFIYLIIYLYSFMSYVLCIMFSNTMFFWLTFMHFTVYNESHNNFCSGTFRHILMPSSGSRSTVILSQHSAQLIISFYRCVEERTAVDQSPWRLHQ
jgi:hypothetical protein